MLILVHSARAVSCSKPPPKMLFVEAQGRKPEKLQNQHVEMSVLLCCFRKLTNRLLMQDLKPTRKYGGN